MEGLLKESSSINWGFESLPPLFQKCSCILDKYVQYQIPKNDLKSVIIRYNLNVLGPRQPVGTHKITTVFTATFYRRGAGALV